MSMNEDRCDCRCIHGERVDAALHDALGEEENIRLANLFKAMGDPNRLKILRALRQEEMCVCDIAVFLGISESAVSHQLRLLRQLYLVTNRRHGPILYYRLIDDHVESLMELALDHIRE